MMEMTEASKQRMNKISKNFGTHYERIYKEGYQAGFNDPDANKKLLDECEKTLLQCWGQLEAGCKLSMEVDSLIEKLKEVRG